MVGFFLPCAGSPEFLSFQERFERLQQQFDVVKEENRQLQMQQGKKNDYSDMILLSQKLSLEERARQDAEKKVFVLENRLETHTKLLQTVQFATFDPCNDYA